jgi:hypothetical protein
MLVPLSFWTIPAFGLEGAGDITPGNETFSLAHRMITTGNQKRVQIITDSSTPRRFTPSHRSFIMVPIDPGNLRDFAIACVIIAGARVLIQFFQLFQ